jgi:2-phosphoglycerate kinase
VLRDCAVTYCSIDGGSASDLIIKQVHLVGTLIENTAKCYSEVFQFLV